MSATSLSLAEEYSPTQLFDQDGFLLDPQLWDTELATRIAAEEGLEPLTAAHWQVIQHIRERFFRVGGLPVMRLVCQQTGIPKEEIQQLYGSCLSVWRVAGLPNPGEEAKAYL